MKSFFSYRYIIAIALVIAGMIFYSNGSFIKKDDLINKNIDINNQNQAVVRNPVSVVSNSKNIPSPNVPSLKTSENGSVTWVDSEEQKNELELWALSRGKVSFTYTDTYDSYDKVTLEALARNNHDVKAMTKLGTNIPGDEGRKWLNMAAIYGSSFALAMAGVYASGIHPTESEGIKKAALIDSLVYKKVAELRNDYYSGRFVSVDLYEAKLGLVLSDQDKSEAEERSHLLYDALEVQRIQLGLGKFDNSVPVLVEAFYKETGLKK